MKKSILLGIAATACWGFSNVLTKALLAHCEPLSLLLIQLTGSNALLWTLFAFCRKPAVSPLQSLRYSLPGILQPGMAYMFGMFGLNMTTANSDALLWACESMIVIFLASIILRERFNWYLIVLTIIGTCGTLMATTPNLDQHTNPTSLFGNALIIAGVICAALYSIYTQSQLTEIEPLRLISLHQLSGLVLVLSIWLFWAPFHGAFASVKGLDFALALVSGTTQYAFSFWLYFAAIKDLGASRSSILLALPPLFTIWGSFIFLKERLNSLQWLGVLIALASVSSICFSKSEAPAKTLPLLTSSD